MSEILSNVVVVVTILAGLAVLVHWVRRDSFTGTFSDTFRGTPAASAAADEAAGRQRPVTREHADLRPATYESQSTTAAA